MSVDSSQAPRRGGGCRRAAVIVLATAVTIIVAVTVVAAVAGNGKTARTPASSSSWTPATQTYSAPASSAPPPASSAPAGTVAQQQALQSAEGYLSDGQGFSRQGLIDQLDSSYGAGFSRADAVWAVDHSGADWKAQAVEAARGYMSDGQGFSRQGLIDQLTSAYGDKFTYSQAVYAVNQVGL